MVLDEAGRVHHHDAPHQPHQPHYAMTVENRTGGDGSGRRDNYYMYSSNSDSSDDSKISDTAHAATPSHYKDTTKADRTFESRGGSGGRRWQSDGVVTENEEEEAANMAEPDDFFGQTREIITFADKGKFLGDVKNEH